MNYLRRDQSEAVIQVNGVSHSYTDTGEGDDTLIFIHPFPFNKQTWSRQLVALSRQHRVITYDIRGFGKSEKGDQEPRIDLFASDLVALMDALSLKKAVACGLSMGGYILMNAISRYQDRFSAVILADTQCIADSSENRDKRFKTIEKIKNNGLNDYADDLIHALLSKKTHTDNKTLVNQVLSMIIDTGTDTITATLKALAERKESCSDLKSVIIPALVICGKEDTVTPQSQAELLINTIPGSKLKIIADAGHLSNMEQPEEFNKHIEEFLTGLKKK